MYQSQWVTVQMYDYMECGRQRGKTCEKVFCSLGWSVSGWTRSGVLQDGTGDQVVDKEPMNVSMGR